MEDVSVSRETINEVYFYRALWQLVFDDVTAGIPTEESQLHVRHILLAFNPGDPYDYNSISDQQRADALARAKDILRLLQNGASFADLAVSSSDDRLSAPNGGDIPWAGEDVFPPPFWEAIKDAPVGSIIGPIESQFGYHIVEILDRGFHPVQPQVLTQRRQELFTQWMESETSKARIERVPDWEQYIPSSPTFEDLLSDIIPQDSPVAQNQIAPAMGNTGTRRIGCGYRVRWMI